MSSELVEVSNINKLCIFLGISKSCKEDKSDGDSSGESVSFSETWGLTDYEPTEIAEQLTLIDAVCIVC
jgi:hypothetical protein